MNRFFKAIAALCIICILSTSIPVTFAASANENDDYLLYGRKQLQKFSESNRLTDAYDRIVEGIENRESSVILEDLALTSDELTLVVTLYRNDPHPHFWLGNTYSYSGYPDGTVYAFKPGYNELGTVSDDKFEKEVKDFNNEINSVIKKAGIKKGMSQYDIELNIHNILVKDFDYVQTENAHNAYGALVEHEAVCQGYTLAYNYILRLCGIEAHYVSGYSRGIPHAWSLICLDGDYYYTDITWDDPTGTIESCNEIYHAYFNLTYDAISADHSFSSIPYELPICNSTVDSYYGHNPDKVMKESNSASLIASFFDHGSASVCVPDELVSDFFNWYSENIKEIAAIAGYDVSKPLTYSYAHMGSEYHLLIDGDLVEPEISVLLGDVDGDGSITGIDANLLRRIVSGSMIPTEINTKGGDMDGDGKLTSIDSNILKRLIAGNN